MKKFSALVTNDDGIESAFLYRFVDALLPHFSVCVAAPSEEQSWIGRAISRRKTIEVQKIETLFPEKVKSWSISGTPSDCVNIALGHLLETPPDIVLSGINLGYNTTEILILSSGTIAGAIEGSHWGHPAIAFSQAIPDQLYSEIHAQNGHTDPQFSKVVQASAYKAAEIARSTLENPPPQGTVLNVNFPESMHAHASIEQTRLEKVHLGSLYESNKDGQYKFQYKEGKRLCQHSNSDRSALKRGNISISELDFSQISRLK
tara:strand:+ start:435 stop:1217 length:783 start_codon:yes stop_codon:yes gene_type:complete